jgi:hypothetical protein
MSAPRRRQTGEISLARTLFILGILLAMLVIPLWLKKCSDDKSIKTRVAEKASAAGTTVKAGATVAPSDQAGPRPIGFGLTFALVPPDDKMPSDVANLSCHGEPRALDQPHKDSCNPYKGDTSCRIVLPVLCLKPGTASLPTGVQDGFYQGWTGGTLAATQPVMGAILESQALATARCEAELGAGWRMAEFHDGNGGWGLQGLRGQGLSGNTRYWVHVKDQRGNCWDSTP